MVAHDLEKTERTEDIAVEDGVTFETMLLPDFILHGLNSAGFKKPSPIQLTSIPLARCGLDLIVQAKSGTGKTLVFGITALESINLNIKRVQVIILAPTREIAFQIADVLKCIGSSMNGLKVGTFVGGRPTNSDKPEIKGCHIAVGSPGRIRHLIELNILDSKAVRLFVLDEADKLFEKDFDYQRDLNYIFNHCGESKQVLALSATYPPELLEFTGKYMREGQHVTPSGGPTPVLLGLRQMVLISRDHPDFAARLAIKEKDLIEILETVSFDQCCVFLNYATRAESINNLLKKKGFASICLTGKQDMGTRIEALNTFRSGACRILVTTDLAARGIDASCINLVINCDVPWDPATYLHRMGRAGRYGSHGICISIISDGIELDKFSKLLGMIGGKSMYVNVIPRLCKVDLWTEDLTNFDKLQGTVDSVEEDSLEEKLKKNFQTANEYLKSNPVYLVDKEDDDESLPQNGVKKDTTQSISLKELEDELNNYLVESVKTEQKYPTGESIDSELKNPAMESVKVPPKQQTPRKSIPKKLPTYSEIVTNSRRKNSPAKKSLSDVLRSKIIHGVTLPENSEDGSSKIVCNQLSGEKKTVISCKVSLAIDKVFNNKINDDEEKKYNKKTLENKENIIESSFTNKITKANGQVDDNEVANVKGKKDFVNNLVPATEGTVVNCRVLGIEEKIADISSPGNGEEVDKVKVPDAGTGKIDKVKLPAAGTGKIDKVKLPDPGTGKVDKVKLPDAGTGKVDKVKLPDPGTGKDLLPSPKLVAGSSSGGEIDGIVSSKRKRSVSSSGSAGDFDSYTYTVNSSGEYETIGDDTSISGIDLNYIPYDFDSVSVISPRDEESEVDYPSEIFRYVDCDFEEPKQSIPTDWFVVISKEIQNYVSYSRQFAVVNSAHYGSGSFNHR